MDSIRQQILTAALATLARHLTTYVSGDWSVENIVDQLRAQIAAAIYADEELDPRSAQGRLLAPRIGELTAVHLGRLEQAIAQTRTELAG